MAHHSNGCSGACCLKVTGLTVTFGGLKALDRVDLHLHCGDIVALIGPNGAGKSTLLKAVLGEIPFEGKIGFTTADGRSMKPLIGYVPQSPGFGRGEPLSVQDLFVACTTRHPVFLPLSGARRAHILSLLDRVRACDLIDKRVGSLSGGELQRVLLALALEPVPHLLVLDEPTAGVDVDGIRRLTELLDEIRTRFDLSILFTTHDYSALGFFASRVVLLDHRVIKTGTPKEVFSSPEFRRVFSVGGDMP